MKVAVLALLTLAVTSAGGSPEPSAEPRVGENVPVTANYAQNPLAQNSPVLAVDPTDERFVALAHRIDHRTEVHGDRGQFGCALQLSGDGGSSWVPTEPVPELPEGADTCYAPQVAFGPDGTLYYSFVGLHGPGNVPMGVFLSSSSDRGRSFSPPQQVVGAHAFAARMAVGDDGRLHLVWLQANQRPPLGGLPPGPNPIMAAHSDNGGATFSEPVQVNDAAPQRVAAPALETAPGGTVHVGYYDLGDDARDYHGLEGPTWQGEWSLVVATAPDGERFTRHTVVDDAVVPPERIMLIFTMPPPALASGPDGTVYLGWHDARNGDWDVFVAASPDHARTWREPVRVNDDPAGAGGHQSLPQLAVADDGRLEAVFYDRRRDPDNLATDVFYASSTDAGQTFTPNRRVTSQAFSSQIGARYAVPSAEGLVELGAGLALHSTRERALTAWTDTRNADGPRHQDIFAAEIAVPGSAAAGQAPAGPARGIWLAAGVAAAALAGGAYALGRRRRTAPEQPPMRRAPRVRPTAVLAGAVGVVAAGALVVAGSSVAAPLPPQPTTVDVVVRDHAFAVDPAPPLASGRVVFAFHNADEVAHELVVVDIDDDAARRAGSPRPQVVPTVGVIRARRPEEDGRVAVDLAPGRYALVCLRSDDDGVAHAELGERVDFEVR